MDTPLGRHLEPHESQPADPNAQSADQRLSALSDLLANLDEVTPAVGTPQAKNVQAHQNRLVQVRLGIASGLFTALRAKHASTASHGLRVALGCSAWAQAIQLSEDQRDALEVSSLLHDIGKIGVPDHILLKPGSLSENEAADMNQHRQIGLDILSTCCASQEILDIVRYAPAWFDGSRQGFDRKGEDLPLGARMLAIVDAYDAMTTDHVYRRAMSRERAIAELFGYANTQFDPELVYKYTEFSSHDQNAINASVVRHWLEQLGPESFDSLWRLSGLPTHSPKRTVLDVFHEKMLDNMHDGVIFVDADLKILLWNRGTERLTGISAGGVRHQRWTPSLVHMSDEHGNPLEDADCPIQYVIQSGVQLFRRLTLVRTDQQKVSANVHIVPVLGSNAATHGAAVILHDASSVITLQERVETLHDKAARDPLTQIFNRAEFDHQHAAFVEKHLEQMEPCSLIICDLDHFKSINDNYGHQAGDEALVNFTSLLKRSYRPGDLVARYGGEEFVMLCANCDNTTAIRRAEQICRELAEMPQPALRGKHITASFGVTEIQQGDTPETMLRRADRALLQAKDMGRNMVIQMGTGLHGEATDTTRRGWASWLHGTTPSILLNRELMTTVPLKMAAEKLRGFIADHHAEIDSIDENHVTLKIDTGSMSLFRRSGDRAVPFLIELHFMEKNVELDCNNGTEQTIARRTFIHVTMSPMRNRDRRRRDSMERARQIVVSLKSYLMAQEYEGESQFGQDQHLQDGMLVKAKSILAPWLIKKQ